MAPKKHKKQSTKRSMEPEQVSTQPKHKNRIWQYVRIIWAVWTAIATVLTVLLGYLTLQPNVSIDYASHLIPENRIGLPLKITNHGYLSIRNIKISFDNKINYGGIINMDVQHNHIDLSSELEPNKSIDYIYDKINLNIKYDNSPPSTGYLLVTLEYQLPILPTIITEQQKYIIFKSHDGYNRWMAVQ